MSLPKYSSLLFMALFFNCCSGSQGAEESRFVPNRMAARITYQYQDTGKAAGIWDTTSHLPSNMIAPMVISSITPKYPEIGIRAHIEAKIIVSVWIEENGNVGKVQALLASADFFLPPTIEAVRQWKFKPLLINGQTQGMWVNLEFNYVFAHGKPTVLSPEQ